MVIGSESTVTGPGMAPSAEPTTLTNLLEASEQFADPNFEAQASYHNVWELQRNHANYVGLAPGSMVRVFNPHAELKSVMRVFRCGAEGAFLRVGTDIFK